MTLTQFTIKPDTAFSLAAAAAFEFGPRTGRLAPAGGEMRLAFATDDVYRHPAPSPAAQGRYAPRRGG